MRTVFQQCAVVMMALVAWAPTVFGTNTVDAGMAASSTIDVLTRELGDSRSETRQHAADELRKIGYPAVKALEAAAQSDDPEVAVSARDILQDAGLGISSRWPPELVRLVRTCGTLSVPARNDLIRRVLGEMQGEAVPFLLSRLAVGDSEEARCACERLREMNDARVAVRLADALKTPRNEWQARALAWANGCLHRPETALRILAAFHAEDDLWRETLEKTIQDLRAQIEAGDFEKAGNAAGGLAEVVPGEARFLYLQGEAWRKMGRKEEAGTLSARALRLNADNEGAHYIAGDMLMDMGCDDLSVLEWETILKIAPTGDVYDINAYLRLGRIAARHRKYPSAAQYLEQALKLYRDRRANGEGGYGMVGASEEELAAMIKRFRRQAPDDDNVADGPKGKQIHVRITPVVKDGRERELQEVWSTVRNVMTVRIQPLGVRLLDLKECRLVFDKEKEEVAILLHGAPCCQSRHFPLQGKKAKIVLCTLDCVYLFEVDPQSGQMTQLDRFEKDYQITIVPDESLRKYKGSVQKVGDNERTWDDLLKGTTIDYLPEALEVTLEGTPSNGTNETLKFSIPFREEVETEDRGD